VVYPVYLKGLCVTCLLLFHKSLLVIFILYLNTAFSIVNNNIQDTECSYNFSTQLEIPVLYNDMVIRVECNMEIHPYISMGMG